MRIKSYFAASVEAAMARAGQELGAEAMLVSSRKALPEARHLGDYEVVFGLASSGESSTAIRNQANRFMETQVQLPALTSGKPAVEVMMPEGLGSELSDLRRELESIRREIARTVTGASSAAPPAASGLTPDILNVQEMLREAELDASLVDGVIEKVTSQAAVGHELGAMIAARVGAVRPTLRTDRRTLMNSVRDELKRRIVVAADTQTGPPNVLAVVGPPGAGKTTTLVKLAMVHGLMLNRPVQFLSMDNYRIGALDQLRSFAGILGVGFEAEHSVSGLARALAHRNSRGLVLIDTPGYGAADLDDGAELANFLSRFEGAEVHLVLAASMRRKDMRRAAERFASYRPSHLIFTKTDETDCFGSIVSEAARLQKPVAFLGTGQRIPEDIEVATKDRLLDQILAPRLADATAASAA